MIDKKVGLLDSLSTKEKETIVAAINELTERLFNYVCSYGYWDGDLNNLKELGIWQTNGNDDSTTPSGYKTWNYPKQELPNFINDGWNTVIVLKPDAKAQKSNLIQMLYCWNDPQKHLYYRVYYREIWTQWKRFFTYDALSSNISNKNLLTNPDFKNPINQRGREEYVLFGNSGYCIDRWNCSNTFPVVKILEKGLKVSKQSGYTHAGICQYMELDSGTYTFTAKINEVNCPHLHMYLHDFENNYVVFIKEIEASPGIYKCNVSVPKHSKKINVMVFLQDEQPSTNDYYFIVEWMKLEPGLVSTQFVSPDPAEELIKCKRYYEKSTPISRYMAVNHGFYTNERFLVSKRIIPTVTVYSIQENKAGYVSGWNGAQYTEVECWLADFVTIDGFRVASKAAELPYTNYDFYYEADAEVY